MESPKLHLETPEESQNNLEGNETILKERVRIAKENLKQQLSFAEETMSDEDVAKAGELLEEYRELVYTLRPEDAPAPESISTISMSLAQHYLAAI